MVHIPAKVWLALTSLVFAGCGGSATTTSTLPPPTSTSTPVAPSTTVPLNPADVFMDTILGPGFASAAVIEGHATVGGREVDISGSAIFLPEGYWQMFEIAGADPEETLIIGADKWERKRQGPWVTSAPGDPSAGAVGDEPDLLKALQLLKALELVGDFTEAGVSYLRFAPPPGQALTAADLGLNDPALIGPEVQIDFLAVPDGTPAAMRLFFSWLQEVEGTETAVDLQVVYRFTGDPGPLPSVDEEWYRFHSALLPYTVAYPSEWEATFDPEAEVGYQEYLLAPDGDFVQVYFEDTGAELSLNEASVFVQRGIEDAGATINANEEFNLGDEPARLITGLFEDGTAFIVAVAPLSTVAVQVAFFDFDQVIDKKDLSLFQDLASTFEIVDLPTEVSQ